MKPTAPTAPLESLDFLPGRIGEALAFFAGGLPEEQYPRWVQKVGADLARQLLPPAWLASARDNRSAFLDGFVTGMLVATDLDAVATQTPADERAHIQRVVNTTAAPVDVSKVLKVLTPKRVLRGAQKDVGTALSRPAPERLAFFQGLALGLDPERSITSAVQSFAKKAERDAALLRLYMWLRWPTYEAMNSIPEAYTRTRKVFETTKRAHVVGSEAAFRRFCNRIGLTYRNKQRAKREGQTAQADLSRDKIER